MGTLNLETGRIKIRPALKKILKRTQNLALLPLRRNPLPDMLAQNAMPGARGWRAKIASIVPSTNTIVEPDFADIAAAIPGRGVTVHTSRIAVTKLDFSTEEGTRESTAAIGEACEAAALLSMHARCDCLAMGWPWFGDYEHAKLRLDHFQSVCGVRVSNPSFACEAALRALGATRVALLLPHKQIGDLDATRFLTAAGFNVVSTTVLDCPTPHAIAEVGEEEIRRCVAPLASADIDALVQLGTNLSMGSLTATLEHELGKPVVAINTATFWYALRQLGIDDTFEGFGRLLSRH